MRRVLAVLATTLLLTASCSDDSDSAAGGAASAGRPTGTGGRAGQGGAATGIGGGTGGTGGGASLVDPAPTGTDCEPLSHGETCTITGGGFGAKDPVAPLLWDNAEEPYPGGENTDGALVPVDDDPAGGYPWRENGHDTMHFATGASLAQRGVSQVHYFGEPTGDNHKNFRGYDYNPEGVGHGHQQMYLSWYIKTDMVTTSASTKLLRLWAGDHSGRTYRLSWTTTHLSWTYVEDVGVAGDEWAMESHEIVANETPGRWNTWDGESALNQWHRNEVYYRQSSASDVADGKLLITTDGETEHDYDLPTWLDPFDACADCIRPGQRGGNDPLNNVWVFGLDPSVYVGDYLMEIDDIYFDSTPARVEICDMATWSQRAGAHCEVQLPTAWSDDRIDITVNRGSFAVGEAYLYVVNGAGLVNMQGVTVSFE